MGTTGLKTKDVKGVVDAFMGVAVEQVKKSGSFKIAGMLNMKLKNKPATKARKGVMRCVKLAFGRRVATGIDRLAVLPPLGSLPSSRSLPPAIEAAAEWARRSSSMRCCNRALGGRSIK